VKKLICVWLLTVGALVSLIAQSTFPEDGISNKKSVYYLFTNTIVHSEPGKADTAAVLFGKGQILAVGDSAEMEISDNTVIRDLSGYHLYPSFIELNTDYGIEPLEKRKNKPGPEYERKDNRAHSWNEAIHPEIQAVNRFSPGDKEAEKRRKMGFGYGMSQLKDGIARGSSVLVTYGEGKANANVLKSEAAMHFSFEKGSSVQDYPSSLMGSIALLRQTLYDAKWYGDAKPTEVNFSLEAINAKSDLPRFFSIKDKYDLERVARIADEFEIPFTVIGVGKSYQLPLSEFQRISAIVAPLSFPDPFDVSDPDLSRYIDQSDLMHWEFAPYNPYFIEESGIPLVLSAQDLDKPDKFFENFRKAVSMGLHADSAIAALTTTPARLIGMEKKIGKLKKGYLSNFFISDGDILFDDDPKVMSHWLGQEEYLIEDPEKLVVSGKYDLNINDSYYELIIKSTSPYKSHILFKEGDDTLKTQASLSLQNKQVGLSFQALDSSGYYRLSATTINDGAIWDGTGIDPLGNSIVWTAIRNKDSVHSQSTDSIAPDSIPHPPAALYPFKAFGFDSLPEPETVLFINATIWTSDSLGVIENGRMLISDGKIKAVGVSIDVEEELGKKSREGYKTIDLKGKHITPGIVDEHSHIAITRGVNEATQTSTAEVRIGDALNPDDINIFRQLSGGVTTAQLLHGSANPIGGQSAIVKLRWGRGMDEMLFDEAPGFIKFALGENVKQSNWGSNYRSRFPQTRMGVEQVFYEYFFRAKTYADEKEIHEAQKKEQKSRRRRKRDQEPDPFRRNLELEALSEILSRERFITCHSYVQSEINMLMHVADSMGFTLNTFTHVLEGYKVADKLKEHGASASTFSDWWAYKFEVNDAIPYNASILVEQGVNTAINSDDAEMGRRLNQEAAKSIKYGGMSEEDALKMVTINPAKMLHVDHLVGSLTEGKHADFVIWSEHPLSVYSIAENTYIDGVEYFNREKLSELEKRDRERRAAIYTRMQEAKNGGAQTRKPSRKMERYYECETID